jgi:hypothetical protein
MKKEDLEKLVVIESPFKGEGYQETQVNILYARACVYDSLKRGEFPYASHLFYTQDGILDDTDEEERWLGINAGIAWGSLAKKTIVYTDRGISKGMEYGIKRAKENDKEIIYRTLPNYQKFLERISKTPIKEGYTFKAENGDFNGK